MRADIDESFKQKGPKKKQSKAGNYEPRMESVSQFESQDDTGGHASSAGQQYDIQAYKEYYDNYGTSIRGDENNDYDHKYNTNPDQYDRGGGGGGLEHKDSDGIYGLKDIAYTRNSEIASMQASERFQSDVSHASEDNSFCWTPKEEDDL